MIDLSRGRQIIAHLKQTRISVRSAQRKTVADRDTQVGGARRPQRGRSNDPEALGVASWPAGGVVAGDGATAGDDLR